MSKMTGRNKYRSKLPPEDFEIWKHYASLGGEDKNRMVTIATSLLGGSAVILWYILTNQICSELDKFCTSGLKESVRVFWVALLGMGVSLLAAYVSLLYGGYSNQNWEKADNIARTKGWYDLVSSKSKNNCKISGPLNVIARTWARPCKPEKELASVFKSFFGVSMLLSVVHFIFLLCSAYSQSPVTFSIVVMIAFIIIAGVISYNTHKTKVKIISVPRIK